jgi:hypothetical protein
VSPPSGDDRLDATGFHLSNKAMTVLGDEVIENMPVGPLRLRGERRPLSRGIVQGHEGSDGPCLGPAVNGLWSTF